MKMGVVPLFLSHNDKIIPLVVVNGIIDQNTSPSTELITLCDNINNTLVKNNINGTFVVFKVSTFHHAFQVAYDIFNLEYYCDMEGINRIDFLRSNGIINIAYISRNTDNQFR